MSRRKKANRTPPPLSSLAIWQPSETNTGRCSHAFLGRQGAAPFPSWCQRNNNSQGVALQWQCRELSRAEPFIASAKRSAAARVWALTPSKKKLKKNEHRAASHSSCLSLPRRTGNRKRDRTESCSHYQLLNGAAQKAQYFSHDCLHFTRLKNDDKVTDCSCAIFSSVLHSIWPFVIHPLVFLSMQELME